MAVALVVRFLSADTDASGQPCHCMNIKRFDNRDNRHQGAQTNLMRARGDDVELHAFCSLHCVRHPRHASTALLARNVASTRAVIWTAHRGVISHDDRLCSLHPDTSLILAWTRGV